MGCCSTGIWRVSEAYLRRRRSSYKKCGSGSGRHNSPVLMTSTTTNKANHEGIKTVDVGKSCEFSAEPSLCLTIVTWNMNGKEASSEDLELLVGRRRKYDLFVIGLQEAPRHSVVAASLEEALLETHRLLAEATMQSLQLYIFGPNDVMLPYIIKDLRVEKHSVGGCGGLIGRKKGAVAISVTVNNTRMAFISCHLSAHADNVEKRNSQCRHISHSLFLKDPNPYEKPFDLTVWMGDLNYRLDGIDNMPARNLIHNNNYDVLTSKDQLRQEAERGEVFDGYCEGTLSFKPTYKYNVGSNTYDTSYKVRVPAWTDRILFKVDASAPVEAKLRSYESIDVIETSDHKPVKAHLCLKKAYKA